MVPQKNTWEELLECRKDGELFWKVNVGKRIKAGDVAGCLNDKGYVTVCVGGKTYLGHRIVWMLHNGYFPENHIDHINRNRGDNRIENLREVSRTCNMRNSGMRTDNTSGVKGVCWNKKTCKWVAIIKVGGKQFTLGYHEDLLEAVCLRLAAEQELGWAGCDSASPAFKYVQQHKNI